MVAEKMTLADLIDATGGSIQTGPFGTKLKASEYTATGVPVISVGEVGFGRIRLHERTPKVDNTIWERMPEYLLKTDDIVFGRKGAVERSAHIQPDEDGYFLGSDGIRVRLNPNECDPKFIAYQLQTESHKVWMIQHAAGTTMPSLNEGIIRRIPIVVPPLPEQKAIAHILGTLDDKIELNRKMNATLEGMAQALFKSWFVDFDPVIDNALAAGNPIPPALQAKAELRMLNAETNSKFKTHHSSFPSKFTWMETMGWIPEGWEVKTFDTLAKLDTTSVKPFDQPETVWEHYSIPSYDSTGMPCWDRGDEIKSNKYLVKPGAILSSKLNPETERTWWPFMMDEKTSICSTEFMQFVPHKKEEQTFVYSLIRSDPFQANILERVTGSTGSRQRAQPKQIAEIEVLDCGENLRAEFIKIALPLFQSIRNNSIQTQTLAKLRDTLLPKLISGELRIPEAELLTEEALK